MTINTLCFIGGLAAIAALLISRIRHCGESPRAFWHARGRWVVVVGCVLGVASAMTVACARDGMPFHAMAFLVEVVAGAWLVREADAGRVPVRCRKGDAP